MKKSKLSFSFIVVSLIVGALPINGFAQPSNSSNQLLWEITGKGLKKPSYLFGTYHSNDNRVFKLSDSTYYALYHSKAVVLEADIYGMFNDYDVRTENYTMQVDNSGKGYTKNKKASLTKYGNEDGRPQFLDAYFQQIAYNSNKQFFHLETVEDQLTAYESITYKDFNIANFSWTKDHIMETYISGDIDNMRQIMKSQLSVSGNAYNLLITNRNIIMANGIDTLIRKNNAFIAVGAAHLAGPEGIVQLMRTKGFHLRPVMATFSETPIKEELELRKFNQYKYTDNNYHFTAIFGGMPKSEMNDGHFKLTYQEMGQGNTYWIEIYPNEKNRELKAQLEDLFSSPKTSKPKELTLDKDIKAYEGLTYIYEIGDCWRRVFIYKGNVFKITCFGGNKFMNSDRYKTFFNRIQLH